MTKLFCILVKKFKSGGFFLNNISGFRLNVPIPEQGASNIITSYFLFSGIGNHQTFVSMLKNNGLKIIKDIEFPDHYEYTETDINNILIEAKNLECQIITTEKDYFRLRNNNLDKFKIIKSELKIIDEDNFVKSLI